ncbi:MAG: hypothetical protein JWP81_1354 [Ferruginibacter sp.]|nr:hypothetical protein [Ferruginibacter sp.]
MILSQNHLRILILVNRNTVPASQLGNKHSFAVQLRSLDTPEHIIDQTKQWIRDVVVGCNFCPFAANSIKRQSIHYQVETSTIAGVCIESLSKETARLDKDDTIETIFLIFPNAFASFDDYLDLVLLAEQFLEQNQYEGIYQLASFHPLYRFARAPEKDAANYTNRSVYPMLHLLREESIDKVLKHYANPEKIPDRNVNFAREKGLSYMKMLRDACL